ncbi:hypothetical protein [Streptomyces sp. NPDC058394]|uniref:hypothetical protein n=1 Tax=Streptomyces sp. NPDC058394 TaxID=3346477 RepID=UPI003655467D
MDEGMEKQFQKLGETRKPDLDQLKAAFAAQKQQQAAWWLAQQQQAVWWPVQQQQFAAYGPQQGTVQTSTAQAPGLPSQQPTQGGSAAR